MKKYVWIFLFCSVFISIMGCSVENMKSEQTAKDEQPVHNPKEKVKYNIDKIIIPVQTEWPDDLKVYRDFNIAVLKEMAKSNNIPVEIKEFPTFDDILIALKRGDVDVMPGINKLNDTDLTKTYTYFTGAIYLPNGKEFVPKTSYAMAVRKKDKELFNFLNDMISNFRETGKLEQIQKKYLGNRN